MCQNSESNWETGSNSLVQEKRSSCRGHSFKLFRPTCKSSVRFNSFTSRVISIWNNLPSDKIDFSSFLKFKKSLTNNILVNYCKVYFS